MKCSFCDEDAVASTCIRVGVFHPARDQRETAKIEIVRLCGYHEYRLRQLFIDLRTERDGTIAAQAAA